MQKLILQILAATIATSCFAAPVPAREATCVVTRIAKLDHRLQDGPKGPSIQGSGSAVLYANGTYQVSYDELPQLKTARVGDPVTLCLISLPQNCPPGDTRGRIYTATDTRIMESWTMPNSEHSCGGA